MDGIGGNVGIAVTFDVAGALLVESRRLSDTSSLAVGSNLTPLAERAKTFCGSLVFESVATLLPSVGLKDPAPFADSGVAVGVNEEPSIAKDTGGGVLSAASLTGTSGAEVGESAGDRIGVGFCLLGAPSLPTVKELEVGSVFRPALAMGGGDGGGLGEVGG